MALTTIPQNSRLLASSVEVVRSTPTAARVSVQAEYLDKKRASAEDFAEAATNWQQNEIAAERYFADQRDGWPVAEEVVYVIAPKDAAYAKIGVTGNPLSRLRHIVAANWEPVYIRALFWVVDGSAIGLEQLALRIAAKSGLEKRGEWIGSDPAGAAYIVGAAAHSLNMKVANSAMWLKQRDDLVRLALTREPSAALGR